VFLFQVTFDVGEIKIIFNLTSINNYCMFDKKNQTDEKNITDFHGIAAVFSFGTKEMCQ
jgi:hypothetical protein